MKTIALFQLYDEHGTPAGGHVYRAPDEPTLLAMLAAREVPAGWRDEEVQEGTEIQDARPKAEEVMP